MVAMNNPKAKAKEVNAPVRSELQPALFNGERIAITGTPDATTAQQVLAVAERAFHLKQDVLAKRMLSKKDVVVTTMESLAALNEFAGMASDRLPGWRMAYSAERLDNVAYRKTGAGIQYVTIPEHLR